MSTAWGDYCGGFVHSIVYIDGDLNEPPSQADVDRVF